MSYDSKGILVFNLKYEHVINFISLVKFIIRCKYHRNCSYLRPVRYVCLQPNPTTDYNTKSYMHHWIMSLVRYDNVTLSPLLLPARVPNWNEDYVIVSSLCQFFHTKMIFVKLRFTLYHPFKKSSSQNSCPLQNIHFTNSNGNGSFLFLVVFSFLYRRNDFYGTMSNTAGVI